MNDVRLGLALGGGGARGFAHVGVLQVLEEAGIRPACIAGTSMGAIVAASYALTGSAAETERLARKSRFGIVRLALAAFYPKIVEHEYRKLYGVTNFEDLALPCCVLATETRSAERYVINTGPLWRGVLASSRVPGVFPPMQIDDRILIDGGYSSLVPVHGAEALGATHVIGVFVGRVGRKKDCGQPTRFSSLLSMADVACKMANQEEIASASVLIEPDVCNHWMFEFHRRDTFIERGREAARAKLDDIKRLLQERPATTPNPRTSSII